VTNLRAALQRSFVGPIVIALLLLNGIGAAIGGLQGPLTGIVKRLIEALLRRAFGDVLLFPERSGLNRFLAWNAVIFVAVGALVFGVAWLLTMWLYVWGTQNSTERPSS
jgi:hypothetical protein